MVYMGYNMINLWYMCDICMLKKIKKKVKKLRFFPVTVVTLVTLIKKTSFRPRIPKEPIVCITSFCHQLFFPSDMIPKGSTSDKLYYFCLPLNYLLLPALKPSSPV